MHSLRIEYNCGNLIGNYIYTTPIPLRHMPTWLETTCTQHPCHCGMCQHDWELHIHNTHAWSGTTYTQHSCHCSMCQHDRELHMHNTHATAACANMIRNYVTQHPCHCGMCQHDRELHIHNTHATAACANLIINYIYTTPMPLRQAPTWSGTTYTQHPCHCSIRQHDWELHIHSTHATEKTNPITRIMC
jgi:hypothetical protein